MLLEEVDIAIRGKAEFPRTPQQLSTQMESAEAVPQWGIDEKKTKHWR